MLRKISGFIGMIMAVLTIGIGEAGVLSIWWMVATGVLTLFLIGYSLGEEE